MVPTEHYNLMPETGKPSLLPAVGLGTARCCGLSEKCSSIGSVLMVVFGEVEPQEGGGLYGSIALLHFLLALSLLLMHGRDAILSFPLRSPGGIFSPLELKTRINFLVQVAFSHGIFFPQQWKSN